MTTTAITPNTYTLASPASIVPSRSNRKHFDADALQALSDNIKARGIDQPIIIRPLPGSRLAETFDVPKGQLKPAYEIVSGERRYRAAAMAGLVQVPVILRSYSDVEAIEAQLVENIQRESLSELDEAEGFELWLQQPGITIDVLADKISKSRRYVFSRLQLLKLQPETKQALRTNQIDVSRALLLAPVHDPKLQIKALDYAATVLTGGTQPSVRDLATWLRQNVMLDLARAPFQITAVNLVPLAGSCKSCPKRTGADPDIFSHVDGADICTDPPCYNNKAAEHIANLEFEAKRKGMRLVHGPEAKAICYPNSSTLNGYSPLSQIRNDLAAPYTGKRLDHILSPSPTVPIAGAVLIENPFTTELITAIPTAEAEAALIAKGLVKVIEAEAPDIKADKARGKKDAEADIAKLKANADRDIRFKYQELLDAAVLRGIKATEDEHTYRLVSVALLRAFYASELKFENGREVLKALDLKNATADSLTDPQVFQVAALFMAQADDKAADQLAIDLRIDRGALKHQAAAQVKAEMAEQIAKFKPQKPSSPTSPLAQPSPAPAADATLKTAKPKGKAKLSKEDAQLGIAEAMQGMEAPPTDGAGAVSKAVTGFTKGQQVRVVRLADGIAAWRDRYIDKVGTIKAINFDCALNMNIESYEVTFKGRTGGVADFTFDELNAVAA